MPAGAYDRTPTIRQRQFVRGILAGMNQKDAAEMAGYSSSTAPMESRVVQTLLAKHMEKAGIDDELLARKLREGLEAKTPARKEGGTRYDDQFVRKQFLDMILRVRGDYAPERTENMTKNITIVMDSKMLSALKDTGALSAAEMEILDAEIVEEQKMLTDAAAESEG